MTWVRCPIRIRGYELDPTGLLPPSAFLRYMEHLRWEALGGGQTQVGLLFKDRHRALIVAQALEVERAVGVGEEVEGTMWIGQVGRTSLEFRNRFELVPGGWLVARGTATAVYLDARDLPTPVPEAIHGAQEEGPDGPIDLEPPEGEVPAGAWTRQFSIRPTDLDLFAHVNHARYLDYVEDTRWLAAADGAYEALPIPARRRPHRLAIHYVRQAVLGDLLEASTWVVEGERPVLAFDLRHPGEERPVCRAVVELEGGEPEG